MGYASKITVYVSYCAKKRVVETSLLLLPCRALSAYGDFESLETNHTRDWHDYQSCVEPCLVSRADCWWRRCDRISGAYCPGVTTGGIKHDNVWDCVLRRCGTGSMMGHGAQDVADIFMRECAMRGHPLTENFTVSLGMDSDSGGDHFPLKYEYKDYSTAISPLSPWDSIFFKEVWELGLARLFPRYPDRRHRYFRILWLGGHARLEYGTPAAAFAGFKPSSRRNLG